MTLHETRGEQDGTREVIHAQDQRSAAAEAGSGSVPSGDRAALDGQQVLSAERLQFLLAVRACAPLRPEGRGFRAENIMTRASGKEKAPSRFAMTRGRARRGQEFPARLDSELPFAFNVLLEDEDKVGGKAHPEGGRLLGEFLLHPLVLGPEPDADVGRSR